MRPLQRLPLFVLALLCLCATPAAQPAWLAPDSFDFKGLLGDPPADGSDAQKQEIDTLLQLQAHRTEEDAARCKTEVGESPMEFAATVVGAWCNARELPVTATLLREVTEQTRLVSGAAKANWGRKRPFKTDARIIPCVELEKSFSYPSGHATRGMVWAMVLAKILPLSRDALMARGQQFGTDRELAGMHYPTDVAAGQKLGGEIVKRMLANPDFQAKLEKAKEECHAVAH